MLIVLKLMYNLNLLKIKNVISNFLDRVLYMLYNIFLGIFIVIKDRFIKRYLERIDR